MKNYLMSRGAEKVVKTCVKVKAGEELLIVTEVSKMSIRGLSRSNLRRWGTSYNCYHGT